MKLFTALVLLALSACSSAPKPVAEPVGQTPSLSPSGTPTAAPLSTVTPSALASPSPTVNRRVIEAPLKAPRAGTYSYAQSGSETFCTATSCGTPQPLPNQMTSTITDLAASAESLTIAIDWALSKDREIKLTTTYSRTQAVVKELYVRFNVGGVQQEQTSHPAPPPQLFRFPYKTGDTWSGQFKDGDIEGTYTGKVARRETGAWVVELTVKTTGEYSSTTAFTFWVDPDDGTINKLKGSIDVKSSLAGYKANFTDTLTKKPS